ncbi:MAG: hypothetical protein AABW51_04745 [Nanoarchaeota archaeon]
MASETSQLIAKIVGYSLFIFIIYLFYKFYYKKESKIAKPLIIFSWVLGIFFSFIGIGSLLFLIISLIFPSIQGTPIPLAMVILFILNIVVFGGLGIFLVLVAKGKWGPKHIK